MAGALSGIRVLDLSRVLAGPWATQILADFGAEVIKIERPGVGDETRAWGPPYQKDDDGLDTSESAYYLCANRNKKSVTIDITTADLRAARKELTTADGRELDMVILGSPHFSLAEFSQLAPLVTGMHAHPRVKFLVTSSRLMKEQADKAGVLAPLVSFGAQITLDTCILASPMLPPEIKTLMTNSAKYAYYAPSLLNTRVTFGSLADCVRSAVEGRVVRDESLWQTA